MATIYDVMKEELALEQDSILVTILSGPRQGEHSIYRKDGHLLYGPCIDGFDAKNIRINTLCQVGGIEIFIQAVEKDPQVLVLGAGHVSRAITDLLLFIGCKVTVVDDRSQYLVPAFFDSRVERVCLDMHRIKESLPLSIYNGFIVVTRAHEFDNVCLDQLRDQLPTYMGVMGSQKRIHYAMEHLRQAGWTEEELKKIHAPIGLDIGGQTPEEIALSIVSEYLACVRGKNGGFLKSQNSLSGQS